MQKKRLQIPGSLGATLGAELDLPNNGNVKGWAIFAHCFTCSRSIKSFHTIAEILAKSGLGVLRFDFTGIGDSEGNFADTHFSTNVDDIVAVEEYLAANFAPADILIGHSLGGTAILHAAKRIPSARAAVTLSAPADPGHVARVFLSKREEVMRTGEATITLGGNHFTIHPHFFDDLDYPQDGASFAHFQKPLLVCHSVDDELLGFEHAEQIMKHAGKPASLISMIGADHLLNQQQDADYVGKMIANWLDHYL